MSFEFLNKIHRIFLASHTHSKYFIIYNTNLMNFIVSMKMNGDAIFADTSHKILLKEVKRVLFSFSSPRHILATKEKPLI